MPIVWLIRHGESQSNVGDQTCCSKETQLTKVGHGQAQEIIQAFFLPSYSRIPSLIITSEYLRSQQTAYPTAKAFPQIRNDEWPVHEFTYLSEKKTLWTTRQERCQFVQQFWNNSDPKYSDGEGAESFIHFITRVYNVIERLRYSKEDFIAVFTHGQFIQAMLWVLETAPSQIDFKSKAAFKRFCREHTIPTGAIQEIEFCGRIDIRFGQLITDHLSITNIYESCSDINTASPKVNAPVD
jgi:2,3-bisphosphoglycerate-dependent phosphoglycerate mutase